MPAGFGYLTISVYWTIHVCGRSKNKNVNFQQKSLFSRSRGLFDHYHGCKSLHTVVNFLLVLNVGMHYLFVLCTTYHHAFQTIQRQKLLISIAFHISRLLNEVFPEIVACKRQTTKLRKCLDFSLKTAKITYYSYYTSLFPILYALIREKAFQR